MKLTINFNIREFDCKNGVQVPVSLFTNVARLAKNLQILRDEIGKPIHINSSYRTEKYNKRIGGAKHSQHLLAKAADITVRDMTPKQVYRKIKKLIKAGKMEEGGIGLYNGFIHYDCRGHKARWDNSSLFNF